MLPLHNPALLRQQALINGQWLDADDGQHLAVHKPANGELIARVPAMGQAETRRAITAAAAAQAQWKLQTGKARSVLLRRWYELIMANQQDLAVILTSEQGKPLSEARGEIAYAASFVDWFADEAKRGYGDVAPSPQADKRIVVLKQPVGVAAAITPWNFPAAMITRKAAPAFAAGCAMVLKPASQTPLTALALGWLAEQAGFPAGLFNVLTGSATLIGEVLTASPLVRKLSFTGSTEVGRQLMAQSAPTIKKLSLELGGNAPFIVFEDADLDAAVEGAMVSKFRNAGQTCVCANRIYVQRAVYERFAAKLVAAVQALQVGDGMAPGSTQGPLIDARAVAKVEEHIADALAKGGRLLCGGQRHALGGSFFEPTVIADASPAMLFAREETFGPLAPLFCFDDIDEVIRAANDSEFGLAGYFYSRDLARAWQVAEQLECGMVGINTGLISNEVGPFGGIKQSGLGREGSRYGMDEYLESKYLCFGGL
ncbi:NAD-dependent succinate-semialdehyde dehydrogenase [Aquitalea magnusonii]|uniref:Succinate-semialdehyde dehydrogenase/glutarate-semialdehyde dehydrogenase n=1 Tax=Aquitalea magnusonii TaxID=332411 RepID=A0A318JPX5_9NEIS|nr:NAD-dependent succinate-semialdehyde dehydrogenase [Aquitalea magnusonii]PXX50625.1 succinate-semialdehyde dehydrogenase/glutarate-semialdehyde dehydrogenase [Aquitalea magnusonii]